MKILSDAYGGYHRGNRRSRWYRRTAALYATGDICLYDVDEFKIMYSYGNI
jgi:hypothetical protein